MQTVSFVIRIKNEYRDIKQTIDSIKSQILDSGIEVEIIIVDNMSTDGGPKSVEDDVDEIIYISDEDFSWGKAINLGIEKSKGNYIVLMSGHCILLNVHVLMEAIKLFDENDIDALYGKQCGDNQKDKIECLELNESYPNLDYFEFDKNIKGIGISNAACILKKEIWKKNKFNEELQSAEDAEWCKRIRNSGSICAYSDKFLIQHGHYFNADYIYKKWYWRTIIIDESRNKKLVKILGTKFFFIIKVLNLTYSYLIKGKKNNLKIKLQSILYYTIICELPRLIARKNMIHRLEIVNKYEDIKAPNLVYKLGTKIKQNEKYIN